MMIPMIVTASGLTLLLKGKPASVSRDLRNFEEIKAAAQAGDEPLVQLLLEAEQRRLEEAAAAAACVQGTQVACHDGQVTYAGQPVHGTLVDRMLQMLDEGFDIVPMARFLGNLMENPSYRAVAELYAFLEHGQNPITEDGCFLAYKAVNERFFDIHSNTLDNSVGQKVSMPRNKVDEDSSRTCSAGLHVCSYDYLPHFARANNGHVVICKVNPRDVVAIPADYNNTKMRVCAYEVIGVADYVYTGDSTAAGDVLRRSSVAAQGWSVQVKDASGTLRHFSEEATLEDARELACELAEKHQGSAKVHATLHDQDKLVLKAQYWPKAQRLAILWDEDWLDDEDDSIDDADEDDEDID